MLFHALVEEDLADGDLFDLVGVTEQRWNRGQMKVVVGYSAFRLVIIIVP